MHSLSESLDLTCGECGRALAFDLWLIVDAGERPDLLARARAGDLHTVSCPTCGPQGEIDAPLLIYLPDHDAATGQPPLVFSPARQTSQEQDQQMAAGLLRELAGRLGAAWRNEWLAQVVNVRRELLPVALSDDPLAAMREHLTRRRGDAEERGEEEENGEGLPAAMREQLTQRRGDAEEGREEEENGEENGEELPPALAAALMEVAAALAAEGVRIESPDDLARALAERPDLAARLEAAMRAEDLPGSFGASGKVGDDAPAATLPDLLNRFIAAASWDESQRIVEAHPELLSDAADERIALALAEYADNPDAVQLLTTHRNLLRRCREAGIARAFAEQMLPPEALAEAERRGLTPEEFLAQVRATRRSEGAGFDIPPEVQPLIAELSRLTQRTDMPRRIELCRQALRHVERNTNPRLWAALQVELGNSYAQSLQGGRAENIEAAIEGYQQALQVMTRQAMPVEWATTMMNLANAYRNRIRGDKAENIEAAIEGYQQALQVRTRQAMPVEWAEATMGLANAYRNRIRGDKAENIEAAIEGYQQALQVMTRQAMPVEWATTMMNLANAYSDRIRGDKAENIEAAIEGYQQALQVMTRQAMPADYVRAARGLGRILFDQVRYSDSLTYMQAVLSSVEEIYEAAPTPESRQSLLQELGDTPQRVAFALCRTDGVDGSQQAVAVLEQNRARWLREALEMSSTRPANVPAALWSAFQTQAQQVRELQAEAQLPDHTPGRRTFLALSALLATARADLSAAVDAIRTVAPDFLPKPTFAQIQSAAHDGPLVYLLATSAGGLALIVHEVAADDLPGSYGASGKVAGAVESLWLDRLTTTEVNKILYDQEDEPGGRYLRGAAGGDHAALTATLGWALPLLGERLAQPLAERLAAHYPPGTPVTLVASSNLGLLPLHAAPVTLEGRTAPLLDFFAVRYAPSATALHTAQQRPAATGAPLLAVGNPRRATQPALLTDWLATEAARLAQHDAVLLHETATVAAVETALVSAPPTHLFFGCHGSFDVAEPLRSGLALADGDLTLAQLLDQLRLDGIELATLCACQTAITDFRRAPDEVIGLPAALLQAGVRGVVGTLWSVEALPTVLLLRRYLIAMAEGAPALAALRIAVHWLRTLQQAEAKAQIQALRGWAHVDALSAFYLDRVLATDARLQEPYPFAGPADWAAFTFTGL